MTKLVWQFRWTAGAEILPTPLSGDRHWIGMTVSAYSIILSSTVRQTPLPSPLPRTLYRLQVVSLHLPLIPTAVCSSFSNRPRGRPPLGRKSSIASLVSTSLDLYGPSGQNAMRQKTNIGPQPTSCARGGILGGAAMSLKCARECSCKTIPPSMDK